MVIVLNSRAFCEVGNAVLHGTCYLVGWCRQPCGAGSAGPSARSWVYVAASLRSNDVPHLFPQERSSDFRYFHSAVGVHTGVTHSAVSHHFPEPTLGLQPIFPEIPA